ncbi:MAG: lactate racemase domain-containing protein, partial [Eubacteriales bacterium]|nr:lactate racemase domain-containing protein [Eubacteriales bacterium]
MEQQFTLNYGEQKIPLTIRAKSITVLDAVTPPPMKDLREAFRTAVEENAVASLALKQVIAPEDEVTVVISDLTRAWMHQERVCPLLLDYLHDVIGVPYENIVFLVALGTHRKQTEAELRRLTGDAVYDRVRVENHHIDGELHYFGTTSRGTDVRLSPLVYNR